MITINNIYFNICNKESILCSSLLDHRKSNIEMAKLIKAFKGYFQPKSIRRPKNYANHQYSWMYRNE